MQLLDLADQIIAVARLLRDQLEQHEPQLAAVEHPPAAATAASAHRAAEAFPAPEWPPKPRPARHVAHHDGRAVRTMAAASLARIANISISLLIDFDVHSRYILSRILSKPPSVHIFFARPIFSGAWPTFSPTFDPPAADARARECAARRPAAPARARRGRRAGASHRPRRRDRADGRGGQACRR